MPTTHVTKDQIESKIIELKKKIEEDIRYGLENVYLEDCFDYHDSEYEEHEDSCLLAEILDDIQDVKISVQITYKD